MSAFLITGLPRSKTAWMSVVASTVQGAMCYHEPVVRFKHWECCFDLWKSQSHANIGIADSGLGFHLERIIRDVNPRILVIRRDLEQVKTALAALGGPQTNYPELLAQSLDRFIAHPSICWATFDGLKDMAIVRQCLEFLIPGCVIDQDHLDELMNMNIQVEMERIWDFAMASRDNADAILGPAVMAGLSLYQ